jgi:GT2 family glycosyltransferase/2-polyprenyl-3-methyl-5-hydroxy-6-metoxy-1,4-benzoquinol methylase
MSILPFTGERFVPSERGRNAYEHYHRYAASMNAARGKVVLDVACGEGFGSALLARHAARVLGVDIDPLAIRHATETYGHLANISFIVGDARAIPLKPASADLVVSFETIEHIADHEAFVDEIVRVLRPDGALIISSPDKENYSDKLGCRNPFHIHELTYEQFAQIFCWRFKHVHAYRQRLATASFLLADNPPGCKILQSFMAGARGTDLGSRPLKDSMYSLLVCAHHHDAVVPFSSSFHLDPEDDLFLEDEKVRGWASGLHEGHEVLKNRIRDSAGALTAARAMLAQSKAASRCLERHSESNVGLRAAVLKKFRRRNKAIRAICRSGLFDIGWYLYSHPEVEALGSDPIEHYLQTGWHQGFDPMPLFSTVWYCDRNLDVRTAGVNPLLHYIQHGTAEKRDPHPLFKADWYLAQNPDVAEAGVQPLRHYLREGWKQGRDPHPLFKGDWYLTQNPEVARIGLNPLVHYIYYGAAEGRPPHPLFDTEQYRAAESQTPFASIASVLAQRRSQQDRLSSSPGLKDLLVDAYGPECQKRISQYLTDLATLKALSKGESSAERQGTLDVHVSELQSLSNARNDARQIEISIIVPAHNHVEYTICCVRSILEHQTKYRYEIIIGDNVSADETRIFFERVGGVVSIVTHGVDEGFIRNCNLSAKHALGRYLVLLNNDTLVLDGWLDALLKPFHTLDNVGLVGSKLLNADGSLQEAGGVFWKDGSAWNFGRNQDPRLPQFNYLKDVDYVSGASIAIPSDLWNKLGGFDERYVPAYCDDSDLAFTIRSQGLRTLYQPFSAVIHHEGVTHGTDISFGIKSYQAENSRKLFDKWQHLLDIEHFDNGTNVFVARDRSAKRPHILVIDHYIPQFDSDAGSRTMFDYVRLFVEAGFQVTFWPDNLYHDRRYAEALQSLGVEVLYGPQLFNQFEQWIKETGPYFQYALLSRAHVSERYIKHLNRHSDAKILFYGHDLHFMRLEQEIKVQNTSALQEELAYWRRLEPMLWQASDVIYYPAKAECEYVRTIVPDKIVRQFPIYMYPDEQLNVARGRLSRLKHLEPQLLFVGGFRHRPNVDAALWFCRDILPKVQTVFPTIMTYIVGSHPPQEVQSLGSAGVCITGAVSESVLDLFYRSLGLAIAPLRFGGGVKGKIIEALRYGLPTVTTSVGLSGIDGGEEFLEIADESDRYADAIIRLLREPDRRMHLASRGLDFISEQYSRRAVIRLLARDVPEMARLLTESCTVSPETAHSRIRPAHANCFAAE